jgi:hypothetical protein
MGTPFRLSPVLWMIWSLIFKGQVKVREMSEDEDVVFPGLRLTLTDQFLERSRCTFLMRRPGRPVERSRPPLIHRLGSAHDYLSHTPP